MDFKFEIGSIVFWICDYSVQKRKVTAIQISEKSICYICDSLVFTQEKDLYSDYDECKKVLILELEKKLKELQE
jgi:hypothetical protein